MKKGEKLRYFLEKVDYWGRLKKLNVSKPLFTLTWDIDSTKLTNEKTDLLRSSLRIIGDYGFPCWIFITPSPVSGLQMLCDEIARWGEEIIIGCHGLIHIPFSALSYEEQYHQLMASKEVFSEAGIDVFAVRTPWMTRNGQTYKVISDLSFEFDFSTAFGFPSTFCSFFLKPRRLRKTIFIPLTTSPDEQLMKKYRGSVGRMSSALMSESRSILDKGGVSSFLIHPVAYKEGPLLLKSLLRYLSQQNISFIDENTFK